MDLTCNNYIMDNNYGIASAWGSLCYMGQDDFSGRHNSIYNNNTFEAFAYQEGNITSYKDYWGEKPNISPGVYLYDLLTENPCSGSRSNINPGFAGNHSLLKPGENIFKAIQLERKGKINEAITIYQTLIDENENTDAAMTMLGHIYHKYHRGDIKDYFTSIALKNLL
jgi:hypothetical protein